LSSAIVECVKIFPDEIQQYIFVPLLNIELKDITVITTIVNTFDQQRKTILLEYVSHSVMYNFNVRIFFNSKG